MAATAAVGLTTALAATPAHAVEPMVADLGLPAVTSFAVDSLHGNILFASGSASEGVMVTDLAGNYKTTLLASGTGAGSISDISVTPDGSYAFVSNIDTRAIDQINLSSLAVTHMYTMPAANCPESVAAVSATSVVFGWTACSSGGDGVGELTTTSSAIHLATTTELSDPMVRLLPATTKVLAVSYDSTFTTAAVLQTSTGTPTVVNDTGAAPAGIGSCEYLRDFSVSPDGTTMLAACVDDRAREFSLSTSSPFSPVSTYPTVTYTDATAFAPDGLYVAAGMQTSYDIDLAVFHHTSTDTSRVYALDYDDTDNASTPPRGLAFSADSSQLYALAYDSVDPADVFLVTLPVSSAPTFPPVSPPVAPPVAPPIAPPIAPPVTPPIGPVSTPVVQQAAQITVQAPPRTTIGVPYAITGTMHYANGLPAVGSTVTITTDVAGVAVSGTTTVGATGTFTDPVDPKKLGWTTITASSAAAPAHYAVSASTNTTVVKGAAKVTVKVAKLHGRVYVVTAHLTSFGVNRHVLVRAGKKVIANLVANKAGLVSVKFTRRTKTVFTVVFTGDANDYPSRASVTLH